MSIKCVARLVRFDEMAHKRAYILASSCLTLATAVPRTIGRPVDDTGGAILANKAKLVDVFARTKACFLSFIDVKSHPSLGAALATKVPKGSSSTNVANAASGLFGDMMKWYAFLKCTRSIFRYYTVVWSVEIQLGSCRYYFTGSNGRDEGCVLILCIHDTEFLF